MVFRTMVGLVLGLLLLCYRESLRCDLWCLGIRWDWNWVHFSDVLQGGCEMGLMVFGTTVGMELDLLLLYCRDGLR